MGGREKLGKVGQGNFGGKNTKAAEKVDLLRAEGKKNTTKKGRKERDGGRKIKCE